MAAPKIAVVGKKMTIEIDLDEPGEPSASGKNLVIASTHGNIVISTNSGPITVGLNVYRKKT